MFGFLILVLGSWRRSSSSKGSSKAGRRLAEGILTGKRSERIAASESRAWVNLAVEMSTIEVSEQVEESPAEAALKIEARIYGSVAPYTDEQLKAIRLSKLFLLSLMHPLELVFLHSSYVGWRWRSFRPSQGSPYPFPANRRPRGCYSCSRTASQNVCTH
jgi:hypothetical protein